MEGGQKYVVIAVLVIVIVGAVVYAVRKNVGGPEIPQWLLDEPREYIDKDSGELITKSFGEWRKLGVEGGNYKNPNTGKYTMVTPLTCVACQAKIVPPDMPVAPEGDDPAKMDAYNNKVMEIQKNFKCPKCGKAAYGMEGMPPAP